MRPHRSAWLLCILAAMMLLVCTVVAADDATSSPAPVSENSSPAPSPAPAPAPAEPPPSPSPQSADPPSPSPAPAAESPAPPPAPASASPPSPSPASADSHSSDDAGHQRDAAVAAPAAAGEDHSGGGGGGHCSGMSHSMPMFFSSVPYSGALLFSWADITSTQSYCLFVFFLVLACVLREYLSMFRTEIELSNIEMQTQQQQQQHQFILQGGGMGSDSFFPPVPTSGRCCGLISTPMLASLLYGVNMALAYLIMLVVMSYDAWLFLVIIASSVAAHYAFHKPPPAARAAHASRVMQQLSTARSPLVRNLDRRSDFAVASEEEQRGLTGGGGGAAPSSSSGRPGVPFPAVFPSVLRTPNPAQMRTAAMHIAATRECCES